MPSPHHIVELEPSGATLVVDRTGTIRSAGAIGDPALDGLTKAVVGRHISSLFPTPVTSEQAHVRRATADEVVNHMFGAGLTLNVVRRSVGGESAERIAAAIEELDQGIQTLARDAIVRESGSGPAPTDGAPAVTSPDCARRAPP